MDFLVLGPVEVRKDGERVPIGGPKQRGILALLIADAGRPVSLQRIVSGVYGDEAAPGAAHSVQTFISMFRRQLGDVVRKDPGGYSLTVDPETIDALRFGSMVDSAVSVAREQPQAAAAALRDALAMWRGHAYADVDGRGDLEPEITRLGDLRLAALEARIDADLATGRHRELVGELDALTIEYPLRERFSGQLMLALYRGGRQTEALRAFERTRIYLAEEIGIDPSPDLRRLEQRILHHDPTLEEATVPSVTQRAVVVLEVADARDLMRLTPDDRTSRVAATISRINDAVERHGGLGPVQRGSALYATFTSVSEAVAAVEESMLDSSAAGLAPRAAIDLGDLELHESGEVSGPPVRRSAGLVAVGHPGQVLLSADAHHALTAVGVPGWVARSLGVHPILGMEAPQQVFQLVLRSESREFPPLLVDVDPLPLPVDRRAVAAYELRRPIAADLSGTTYRAYHPMAGREVVVTVIDPVWANQPDFVRRFEVETQLVGRLNHLDADCEVDVRLDDDGPWYRLEGVNGVSLAAILTVADTACAPAHLPAGALPPWKRKRLAEDLPALMDGVCAPLGATADLALRDRQTGAWVLPSAVPVTEEKRAAARLCWPQYDDCGG
jgi:DNA-binding SARP family transcriptional activator